MECIVLAGGTPAPGDTLAPWAAGRPKALLDVAGRPMIAWVLDALAGSRHVDRIVVVGLDPSLPLPRPASVVVRPDRGSMVANFYDGLACLTGRGPAAFCWADIPLVEPAMIDRFIEGTPNPELDLNVGFVRRSVLQARYPEAEDLWLRLREGHVIAADFGLFHARHTARIRPILETLEPLRKSAARQALRLGWPLVLRYLTRRLSMSHLERYVARHLGVQCGVRLVDDPELGLDVDTAADLAICRRVLARRGVS